LTELNEATTHTAIPAIATVIIISDLLELGCDRLVTLSFIH